jgi:hypothetical protein
MALSAGEGVERFCLVDLSEVKGRASSETFRKVDRWSAREQAKC